ncbi:outer membrane beta-barrel protein [Bdellovibrionota bacterium FG-1]
MENQRSLSVVTVALFGILLGLAMIAAPQEALAGKFELSNGFSYSRTDYGSGNFSWTRRWGASFGYHFSERSEFEFSFQDVVQRTAITSYEDTTFHDQVYSVNWVQSLLGKAYTVDPYFKIGAGQLNREASGNYGSAGAPASEVDAITVILGAGLRINLSRSFALRGELDADLTGGNISTWKDNIGFNAGFSFFF